MAPVTRDENGEGEVMGCACFQRGDGSEARRSTVSEADDTTNSVHGGRGGPSRRLASRGQR
jgi:hypothetical protein